MKLDRLSFSLTLLVLIIVQTLVLPAQPNTQRATFAGGCYWCMEEAFERIEGVSSVVSGFTAGVEAVEIVFDPATIDYQGLLKIFWKNIDPTDAEGQFCDRGAKYRSAIFYHSEDQAMAAEESKREVERILDKKVATALLQSVEFKPVAESEQDFYKKKPFDYKQYKIRCGRERRLRSIWE